MHGAVADQRAQAPDLVDLAVDEGLPAEAGVHGHHANQIAEVQERRRRLDRRAGIEREAGLAARRADRLQRAVRVRPGLEMRGQHIRAGLGIGVDIGIDRGDHQVHVHHGLDVRADRLAERRAEGEVRHEMPVHHVDMDPVRALRLDRLDLLPEVGEIGREDRRGDLDGTVKGHGAAPCRFDLQIRAAGGGVKTHHAKGGGNVMAGSGLGGPWVGNPPYARKVSEDDAACVLTERFSRPVRR